MEQLFAVRVLVHYYDKPKVDHAAVRRLLASADVDALELTAADGTTVRLSDYINTPPGDRKIISEVATTSSSSLLQVASVFMLAEARAAADALCTSPTDLETACSALERLLGCLATRKPFLPIRDIKKSARVKLGTAARRRAFSYLRNANSSNHGVSILKAVNAILRLCDVATHCLAVVCRHSLQSKQACETAINLSTRLLTLAASLYQVQRVDSSPALSFCSSDSLRTALVSGAMHLGAITIEHYEIEPMPWVHIANRVLTDSNTSISPRTSVLSALFGGMISGAKRYETADRDTKAAEGAICLLSTLHVVLEADMAREARTPANSNSSVSTSTEQRHPSKQSAPGLQVSTAPVSQAARSFLGERVVSAEEDGDEARIAARTVYQACEEYAERAGETDGMLGLLARLFAAAAKQCRQECSDEPVVSLSDGTLPCPPDESDASSDGPHRSFECQVIDILDQRTRDLFSTAVDVFDQRSKDGFVSGPGGCNGEMGTEQAERIEMHRAVGALALDTLSHWVDHTDDLRQCGERNFPGFCTDICRSASLFVLGSSSSSYDLKAAMIDFGALLGPKLRQRIGDLPEEERAGKWKSIVTDLTESCMRMTPIFTSIITCNRGADVVNPLLSVFLQRSDDADVLSDRGGEEVQHMPTESILHTLVSAVSHETAFPVMETILNHLKYVSRPSGTTALSLSHCTACLMLISYSASVLLEIGSYQQLFRVAFASLYHRDMDSNVEPIFPELVPEMAAIPSSPEINPLSDQASQRLIAFFREILEIVEKLFHKSSLCVVKKALSLVSSPGDVLASSYTSSSVSRIAERHCYHLFWSSLRVLEVVLFLEKLTGETLQNVSIADDDASQFPLLSPFICCATSHTPSRVWTIIKKLGRPGAASFIGLYTAECLAILLAKEQKKEIWQHFPELISIIVNMGFRIASNSLYNDLGRSYDTLKKIVTISESKSKTSLTPVKESFRATLFSQSSPRMIEISSVKLVMFYVRRVGSGQISDLLGEVFLSATSFLDRLIIDDVLFVHEMILEASKHFIFLPDSCPFLCAASRELLMRLVHLAFPKSLTNSIQPESLMWFVSEVCGFSHLVKMSANSSSGIQALCLFARDIAKEKDADLSALEFALQSGGDVEKFGTAVSKSLTSLLPNVSFTNVLRTLLVPGDDSAVTVSSHSQSLELLKEACELSGVWRNATLDGLNELLLGEHDFVERMVNRSIMESATMNDGVLSVFEGIVGKSNSNTGCQVLYSTFRAACEVFENTLDAPLQSRIRLLNFVVRLTIAYGHVSVGFEETQEAPIPPLLEPGLFHLIVNTLSITTKKVQIDVTDEDSKQMILFLCGLLDCIHDGIYRVNTVESNTQEVTTEESVAELSTQSNVPDTVSDEADENSNPPEKKEPSPVPQDDADSQNKALCTYNSTGNEFIEQHWYFCYSCELAGSEGVCCVCARICHEGCELAYSKFSRFFCDCGAGSGSRRDSGSHAAESSEDGDRSNRNSNNSRRSLSPTTSRRRKPCQCLKTDGQIERQASSDCSSQSRSPTPDAAKFQHERDTLLGSRLQELIATELKSIGATISPLQLDRRNAIRTAYEEEMNSNETVNTLMSTALYLTRELDCSHVRFDAVPRWLLLKEIPSHVSKMRELSEYFSVAKSSKLTKMTKVLDPASIDVSEETSSALENVHSGSLLSHSRYEQVMAAVDKSGSIEFVSVCDVLKASEATEKCTSGFRRATIPYPVKKISFHPGNSNLLLVIGNEKVSVLCRAAEGGSAPWNTLNIEIGLTEYEEGETKNSLISASWVHDESTLLLLVTEDFVKIFDVAADTFSPCFYAKRPSDLLKEQKNPVVKKEESEGSCGSDQAMVRIADAVAIPDDIQYSGLSHALVLILLSNGDIYVARLSRNDSAQAEFFYCFSLEHSSKEEKIPKRIYGLQFHLSKSLATISFDDGSLMCFPIYMAFLDANLHCNIPWIRLYKEVLGPGCRTELILVPGSSTSFLFYQIGQSLRSAGVLSIRRDKCLEVDSFSGSSSAVVLGVSSFAPSSLSVEPAVGGGLVLLNDGSVYRADLSNMQPRVQVSSPEIVTSILDRQKKRCSRLKAPPPAPKQGYRDIPDIIGFFEKCRSVSDQMSISGGDVDSDGDFNYEDMRATLTAVDNDESAMSPKPNEPFKFTVSIDNPSLVLVGARLCFGGTERSRNRVPKNVKVFERSVQWTPKNGKLRWLDMPFSVPESTNSPQKVTFEIQPRRSVDDSASDGRIALDALDLFAVSSIEFTERKLVHEKEKSSYFESLNTNGEASEEEGNLLSAVLKDIDFDDSDKPGADTDFNEEQTALLTIVGSIDRELFSSSVSKTAGALVFEINNLWAGATEKPPKSETDFLEYLLRAVAKLYSSPKPDRADEKGVSILLNSRCLQILSKGALGFVQESLACVEKICMPPQVGDMEKILFAVGGLARSLITSGVKMGRAKLTAWLRTYDELMPSDTALVRLLQAHLSLGRTGRLLYRSHYNACINSVDMTIAGVLKGILSPLQNNENHNRLVDVLMSMICSLDQDIRLGTRLRLVDLLNAPGEALEIIGSPLESITTSLLWEQLKTEVPPPEPIVEAPIDANTTQDPPDGRQRWAYRCDVCKEVCEKEWWHCDDCRDYDLCTKCFRESNSFKEGGHQRWHILLHGTACEDTQDQADEQEPEISLIAARMQEVIGPVMDNILTLLASEKSLTSHWRYLEGAEVLALLLGPTCPEGLRKYRLKSLFESSFPQQMLDTAESIRTELEGISIEDRRSSFIMPRQYAPFSLMIRIFLSAEDSGMAAGFHRHLIPGKVFLLMEQMRAMLRDVMKNASERNQSESSESCDVVLSKSVWNHRIPRVSSAQQSLFDASKNQDSFADLSNSSEELRSPQNFFMSLMIEVLLFLALTFKSASSIPIIDQMKSLPRDVLCDLAKFHEVAQVQDEKLVFTVIAAAATALLATLSLDDNDVLNHHLHQFLYKEQTERLREALRNSKKQMHLVPYDEAVEIAAVLQGLHKAARRHPETWRTYVRANETVLQHVYNAAKSSDGMVQVTALQLLGAGIAPSKKCSSRVMQSLPIGFWEEENTTIDKNESPSASQSGQSDSGDTTDGTQSLAEFLSECKHANENGPDLFLNDTAEILKFLLNDVLLRSQTCQARIAASHLLVFAIARTATEKESGAFLKDIQRVLYDSLELMPYAGQLADGLMTCLQFFILCCQENLFGDCSASLLTSVTGKVTALLKERCNILVSHPNARLYGRLSGIIDMSGYYLESDPCLTCAAAVWESSERRECRLDNIRAETKYTDSSIMHRFTSIHEVSSVLVKIIDPRRSRRAKRIEVFYSARIASDAAELKSADHPWRKLKTFDLDYCSTDASIVLIVPIAMANIKLAFTDFHTKEDSSGSANSDSHDHSPASSVASSARRGSPGRGSDTLQCPRCSRSVTDRHGICRNCHENAYQCRQCRNINYENLDGFLCNECGYCKHGRFEFSICGRPTHVSETILSEEDRKRASRIIEKETNNVHRCMEQLVKIRSSIIRSLISGSSSEQVREPSRGGPSTRFGGLANLLDSVTPRSDMAVLEALLEGQASPQEMEEATNSTQGGASITEEVLGDGNGSVDGNDRDQSNRAGSNATSPANRTSRGGSQSKSSQSDSNVVSKSTSELASTYGKECRTIFSAMCRGVRVLTMTRAELVRYANTVGGNRLRYAEDLATNFKAYEHSIQSALRSERDTEKKENVTVSSTVCCYGCTQSFVSNCVTLTQTIMKGKGTAIGVLRDSDLAKDMMLICALCENSEVRDNIRELIGYLVNDNRRGTKLVCSELSRKIGFCIESYETVDSHYVARFEMAILEATAGLDDSCWEERLRLVLRILLKASQEALTCSSVAESIILPCMRVALRLLRADSSLTVLQPASESEGITRTNDSSQSEGRQQNDQRDDQENPGTSQDEGAVTSPVQQSGSQSVVTISGNSPADASEDGSSSPTTSLPFNSESANVTSDGTSHVETTIDACSIPSDRQDIDEVVRNAGAPGVDVSAVDAILENLHDAKVVTANVGQWLDGHQTHSSWVSQLGERIKESSAESLTTLPQKEDSLELLRSRFEKWRQIGLRKADQGSPSQNRGVFEAGANQLAIQQNNWIVRLMLLTPCTAVRKEACALLEVVCGQEESIQLQLLDILTGPALTLAAEVGEKSKEFFDLLEALLAFKHHRLYLIAKGFLPRLSKLIQCRAEKLILAEVEAESSFRMANFLDGYSLKRLVSLLRQTLEVIPSDRLLVRKKLFETENSTLVWSLQRAYICVRKLISTRTRLTDECSAQLCEVLLSPDFLFAGDTVSAVVSACVSELKAANERNDAQGVAILLEELCNMLCPQRKEPTCLVALHKAPTQEEFIRGSMSRNPYPSTSFDGPFMRDVKNKICRDLDLPGLLEDDFAMELLVAGNLVRLDLPIMSVYEHVWRGSAPANMSSNIPPSQISRAFGLRRSQHGAGSRVTGSASRAAGLRNTILNFRRMHSDRISDDSNSRGDSKPEPPMVVVYRLSGLDGEATEPIIDSLPSDANNEQDSEETYRDTIVLGEVGGLHVLFDLLAVVGSWGDDAETAVRAPALRLLRASCEVAQNRALLAKSPIAVSTLLDCAASAFEHAQGSPAAVVSAESLLIAAERILAQQRNDSETRAKISEGSTQFSSQDPEEDIARVRVFLGSLAGATSQTAENSILHLLPFLIQGIPGAIDLVLEHLMFDWDSFDTDGGQRVQARMLGTVLFATPQDSKGTEFVVKTLSSNIGSSALAYVTERFPVPRQENKAQWMTSLEGEGSPLVLRLLTGLCHFLGDNGEITNARDVLLGTLANHDQIIPVLCRLEMAVSGNAIGTSAEELLAAMSKNAGMENSIAKEREVIRTARREAANASRALIMMQTGLTLSHEERVSESNVAEKSEKDSKPAENEEENILKLLEELPDETGPSCVVCGDGFKCRPEEALAFYVYCRKVPLDLFSSMANGKGANGKGANGKGLGSNSESGFADGRRSRLDWEAWSSNRSPSSAQASRSGSSSCCTTVTHLNAIHHSCHKDTARVDRSFRREEWDGASLRNSQTKCNNLFPIRPPATFEVPQDDDRKAVTKSAKSSYVSAVETYFSLLTPLGRTSLSQGKIVSYDIARSLLRFADGGTAVFSEHSKGGGPHSNACLLPHLMQLAIYITESAGSGKEDPFRENSSIHTQQGALSKYLNEEEPGDLTYYLASSLVLQDLGEWHEALVPFVRRGVRDVALPPTVLLRMIAFTDAVHRRLKRGVDKGDRHWLNALRRHIGDDETFAQSFGEDINNGWEDYLRSISDPTDFVAGLKLNMDLGDSGESENASLLNKLDGFFKDNRILFPKLGKK